MMPDFIEEVAKHDALKLALVLKSMQLMTSSEYEEVSAISASENLKRATQLVHTMYKMIKISSYHAYVIRSVLSRVGEMYPLIQRWDNRGKHFDFLVE